MLKPQQLFKVKQWYHQNLIIPNYKHIVNSLLDCEQSLFSSVRAMHASGSNEALRRAKQGRQPEKKKERLLA